MEEPQEIKLSELVPVREQSNAIIVPCIPTGDVAIAIRKVYEAYVKNNFGSNHLLLSALPYDEKRGTLTHSNFFALNVLGQALRVQNPAFDITSRNDLLDNDVAELVRGVYIDAQDALVLRGTNKFYDPRDELIFKQLAEHVDNLKTPVLLEGLKVVHSEETGYGLSVTPTQSFSYTHDESKFGKKGSWIESPHAISGLYRVEFDLNASGSLAFADVVGRVVLVSRRADAQNLERFLDEQARNELLQRVNSIREATDALAVLVHRKE